MSTDPASSSQKERLRELVARVLEGIERDGSAAVEQGCRDHPDLAAALRQRIEKLCAVGLVEVGGSGEERMPERLGDFRLIRRLGSGGMGVVYLAEQTSLRREVALKLVRPELLYFPGARARFRREVEAVARLNHPGIVPIYVVDDDSDPPYFAMERVDGVSLDAVLRPLRDRDVRTLTGADLSQALATPDAPTAVPDDWRGRGWVELALRLVRQAAEAIDHAHQRGVIHRDLKPSNLMLTRDGRVRIVDFGLATTEGTTQLTRTGSQFGSLPYTAPEQLEHGAAAVDARSDVYALGTILYELLALKPAFFESAIEETRRRILDGRCTPLRQLHPTLSWDAETVCATAMERDPARRYPTAAAFVADLTNVLELKPVAARRAGPWLRVLRFGQRRPALAVGALLGGLIVVGGPALWALQEKRRRDAVEAQLHETTLARDDAKTQAERARRGAARARQAVTELLSMVGEEVLRNVPRAELVRRDLLARATQIYEGILADSPGDAEVAVEMAQNFRRLGVRQGELGDFEGAQKSFARGSAILAPFAAAQPGDVRFLRVGGGLAFESGVADLQHGSGAVAGAKLAAAVADLRRAVALDPESQELGEELATALTMHALADGAAGRYDVAIAESEDAIAGLGRLVAHVPAATEKAQELRDKWFMARVNLGALHWSAGHLDAAAATLRALAVELGAEVERAPGREETRWSLAGAWSNLGRVLDVQHRGDEATGCHRTAATHFARLAADYPNVPRYRDELVRALARLTDPPQGTAEPPRRDDLERLVADAEAIVRARPAELEFVEALCDGARRLAVVEAAAGEVEPASRHLARALDLARSLAANPGARPVHRNLLLARALRAEASNAALAATTDVRIDAALGAVAAAVTARQKASDDDERALARGELLGAFDDLLALRDDGVGDEELRGAAAKLRAALPGDTAAAQKCAEFSDG